jgi:hypothetical protein
MREREINDDVCIKHFTQLEILNEISSLIIGISFRVFYLLSKIWRGFCQCLLIFWWLKEHGGFLAMNQRGSRARS